MPVLSERMSQLGTESTFGVLARANTLRRQGRSIINLGIGQPDFPTPTTLWKRGAKRSPTGITAIRLLTASCRCVKLFRPISIAAMV